MNQLYVSLRSLLVLTLITAIVPPGCGSVYIASHGGRSWKSSSPLFFLINPPHRDRNTCISLEEEEEGRKVLWGGSLEDVCHSSDD